MNRIRHARMLAALLAVAGLVTAACSGAEGEGGGGEPRTYTQPLTGEVTKKPLPDRPVLVVKVDNTAAAEPQVGQAEADLVVEEVVEGGVTRLAVMHYSRLPQLVGPVRSERTSDIGIVQPTGGVLVASGGAPPARAALKEAGVVTRTEGAPGFVRVGDRSAPYNVMLKPQKLVSRLDTAPPDQSYLPWADKGAPAPKGATVTSARVSFSPSQSTDWAYSGGGWTRENGIAAPGDGFVADNLLVLRVRTKDAGYKDPAGNFVPETVLTGEGRALLMLGDRAVKARWSKGSDADPLEFSTRKGEFTIPPGRTWINLVPPEGDVSTS